MATNNNDIISQKIKIEDQDQLSKPIKDEFDGFYDNNHEPEAELIIAKAIQNENEITKVLENSKKSRMLNRQNSINKGLENGGEKISDDTPVKVSPKKILTRQNSFKSVKKFFQVMP